MTNLVFSVLHLPARDAIGRCEGVRRVGAARVPLSEPGYLGRRSCLDSLPRAAAPRDQFGNVQPDIGSDLGITS